ncbi:MAG: cytochrome c biogenesis CcdA family protein [Anaerolineae bacterium]
METPHISLFLALSAGVLSFASPCVLPLVPAYLGYLSGAALTSDDQPATRRWTTFLHALAFVVGFSVVFTALGASMGMISHLLYSLRSIFQKIGGVVLVIFGLHTMGLWKIPFLYREWRLQVDLARRWGLVSSFLVGTIFAAAWTPCVGPILAGILILASTGGSVGQGASLLFVYSLGLGIPFLLVGLSLGWATPLLRRLNRHGQAISILSGILLTAMGFLVFTDTLFKLTGYLSRYVSPLLGK